MFNLQGQYTALRPPPLVHTTFNLVDCAGTAIFLEHTYIVLVLFERYVRITEIIYTNLDSDSPKDSNIKIGNHNIHENPLITKVDINFFKLLPALKNRFDMKSNG